MDPGMESYLVVAALRTSQYWLSFYGGTERIGMVSGRRPRPIRRSRKATAPKLER